MPDYSPVRAGEAIEITAETWNGFQAAAAFTASMQNGGGTGRGSTLAIGSQYGTRLKVQNVSGSTLDSFTAVAVSGVIQVPSGTDITAPNLEFINSGVLKVTTPSSDDSGKWMVLQQPLNDKEIGFAVEIGATVCKVNVVDVTHKFVEATGTTPNTTDSTGYNILYVKGGVGSADATGEQFCVIRIDGGGSTSSGLRLAKISSITSLGVGWYNITLQEKTSDPDPTTDLVLSDWNSAISEDEFKAYNLLETGLSDRLLAVGTFVQVVQAFQMDGSPVFRIAQGLYGCD